MEQKSRMERCQELLMDFIQNDSHSPKELLLDLYPSEIRRIQKKIIDEHAYGSIATEKLSADPNTRKIKIRIYRV